jgi:trk system potassium uptake protein TrkA
VAVIDVNSAAFNNLPADFDGRVVEGDALSQDVLHRAGIEHAEALAAMTNSDALNAVVAHVARDTYHVENVVVRNYDPICRPILEAFNFQMVSATVWGAQRVEEIISHQEIRTIFSAGNGEIEVYEFTVPPSWNGKGLATLLIPTDARAISLSRDGRAFLPGEDEPLQTGDILLVSATFEGAEAVRQQFKKVTREA